MDVVRITELQPKTYVEQGDYIAIDNQNDGTKKVQFTNLLDNTLSQENKIAPANVVGQQFTNMSTSVAQDIADVEVEINALRAAVGSPLKASTVAQMTDKNKIYVYVGSESGYTNGNWYYWNGSAWTSGGVYNSVAVVTDPTLTLSGVPADAKATGDEVTNLKSDLKEAQDVANQVSFDVIPIRTYTISETDAYKNAFLLFPLTAGCSYRISNKSASAYIAVFSCTNNVSSPSSDVETIVAGLNAGRSTTATIASNANYLRVYCTATPVVVEIELIGAFGTKVKNIVYDKNLVVCNKINYFDKTRITDGCYLYSDGSTSPYAGFAVTDFIPISNGETLKISKTSPSAFNHCLYDENFNFVSAVSADNDSLTGTSATKYARFTVRGNFLDVLMIYKGVLPNRYVPYSPVNGYDGYPITAEKHFTIGDYQRFAKMEKESTTFTNDLFGEEVTNARTSAYIEVNVQDVNYYIVLYNIFSQYYDLIRFYDKDKNQIAKTVGGIDANYSCIPLKLVLPNGCQYIRFAQYQAGIEAGSGVYKGYPTTFEQAVSETVASYNTDNNNVLWIGTSIPEGATYPNAACETNGYACLNKSLGSSKLCFEGTYISGADNTKGRRLTATVAELQALYADDVTQGIISDATYQQWLNYSYENSIIPYIDGTDDTQVSMIVIDHGFNDRSTIYGQMQNVNNINWDSDDRSTFTGAFKYLVDKIQAINPFIKIVISGYFTNTVTRLAFDYYSPQICDMQTLIGAKYDISVMKAWEHSQISDRYIAGTDDYISDFNTEYGTSYTKITPDADGNITSLQLYCPDGMHPHSDLTGNCNKRLNAVYTKLLAHMI